MGKIQASIGTDNAKWTFGGLARGEDGKFKDDDLAKILLDA